jgi:AraC family transcriptional regulator of adaptative response/methylated-DNA-[protein]-cysteine methyltransferase
VSKACALIAGSETTPDLQALARAAGLSPSHFHRVFKSQTGLTPKAYAIAGRAARVREVLSRRGSVTTAIYSAGFNSSSRFYAQATEVLGMTPTQYRNGGQGARILFAVRECSLGCVLVAAARRGICAISLGDDPQRMVQDLVRKFPKSELIGGDGPFEKVVARVIAFVERPSAGLDLPLEVQGTAFQHRVWRKLRRIPSGRTFSYAQIARALGEPGAARAVARACASNPVAVAIPCHRVVRSDQSLSGYRWGVQRKARLLALEHKGSPPGPPA